MRLVGVGVERTVRVMVAKDMFVADSSISHVDVQFSALYICNRSLPPF